MNMFHMFMYRQDKNLQLNQYCKFRRSSYLSNYARLGTVLIASQTVTLILTTTLRVPYYYHPHFTDNETEGQIIKKGKTPMVTEVGAGQILGISWASKLVRMPPHHTANLLRFYSDIRKTILLN